MAKFVVIANKLTGIEQDTLTIFIQNKGWEFWHWFENSWLLAGVPVGISAEQIWQELETLEALRGQSIVIMKVSDPIRYWGRSSKPSWDWMKKYWGKP